VLKRDFQLQTRATKIQNKFVESHSITQRTPRLLSCTLFAPGFEKRYCVEIHHFNSPSTRYISIQSSTTCAPLCCFVIIEQIYTSLRAQAWLERIFAHVLLYENERSGTTYVSLENEYRIQGLNKRQPAVSEDIANLTGSVLRR